MIGTLVSKPLMVIAAVLGVVVVWVPVALYRSVSENGALEARNNQLTQDAIEREEYISQMAELSAAKELALSKHRFEIVQISEELDDARIRLDKIKVSDCDLGGDDDFFEWLQHSDNLDTGTGGRNPGAPPSGKRGT